MNDDKDKRIAELEAEQADIVSTYSRLVRELRARLGLPHAPDIGLPSDEIRPLKDRITKLEHQLGVARENNKLHLGNLSNFLSKQTDGEFGNKPLTQSIMLINRLTRQRDELAAAVVEKYCEIEIRYHRMMSLLKQARMKHGMCQPRARRACTACNASEELDDAAINYRGGRVELQSLDPAAILAAHDARVRGGERNAIEADAHNWASCQESNGNSDAAKLMTGFAQAIAAREEST